MSLFSNLRLYRLHSPWPVSEEALSEQLATQSFKPCGALTERSSGWESPNDGQPDLLCRRIAGADLLRLRSQSRVLPAAALREALDERVAQFQARQARPPSRKEKRDLKDDLFHELLPQALVKSDRILGFCLIEQGIIGVDSASEKDAERFLDILREALGTLMVTPLAFNRSFGEFISSLYLSPGGPTQFRIGRECRMSEPGNTRASVQWQEIDIVDADVRKHVTGGLRLERLALEFDEVMSCVADREGVLRKIKLLGMEADTHAEEIPVIDEQGMQVGSTGESAQAKIDAEFVLLTGVMSRFVGILVKLLDGFSDEDTQVAAS